jgi:DNA modification methylase
VKLIPDYLCAVQGRYAWVLDAKSPQEEVLNEEHRQQIYSYAIHPDIRVKYYALCNGREFILFQIDQTQAVLHFSLADIAQVWEKLTHYLAPPAFQPAASGKFPAKAAVPFDYLTAKAPTELKSMLKQSAKRHYGVHGYFTKQVWNVVQEYVRAFTRPGDVVLDPFGGSGVTAVEALMLGRKAIHLDLNPLSIFLVENLLRPVSMPDLAEAYNQIVAQFEQNAPRTKKAAAQALAIYPYPKNIPLPKNSDVPTLDKLYTPQQLAQLAYLKHLIKQVSDPAVQGTLMLMFSGLLNQINLTYHASSGRSDGRGNSSMFQYYRYRIAPNPSKLEVMARFKLRYDKVIAAKKEIAPIITAEELENLACYKGTATRLDKIGNESVDYIYTDPPYGAKIPYLDLSVMWNAWLDLTVTPQDYELEVIEGGEKRKTKEDYATLLAESIEEMYRVLKFNRWMSFVFAHQDPAFWHLIIDTAEKAGFEYAGATKQSNGKTSYKKRQNPFTVLSGQLIINFKKIKNPKAIMKVELGADIAEIVVQTIEGIIAQNEGATIEEINDELIIKGLELGFLDILSREYKDVTPFLLDNFAYDDKSQKYHLRRDTQFKSRIDVRLRIRYYLISFLRRKEREGTPPTFDEIVLNIIPLLKNGKTPENQTIRSVLEEIATHIGSDRWQLTNTEIQPSLFDKKSLEG